MAATPQSTSALRASDGRLMWLGPSRVFYADLLGATSQRSLGGHGIHVSQRSRGRDAVGKVLLVMWLMDGMRPA